MTNPLVRVAMKNLLACNDGSIENKEIKTLGELTKKIKGESVEKEEEIFKTGKNTYGEEVVKSIKFNDIIGKTNGSKVKIEDYSTNISDNETENLTQLAERIRNTNMNISGTDNLYDGKIKNSSEIEDEYEVGEYVDFLDKKLISNLINGSKNMNEIGVRTGKVLNLNEAVKSIINR